MRGSDIKGKAFGAVHFVRAGNSAVRVPSSHGGSRRFKSSPAYLYIIYGADPQGSAFSFIDAEISTGRRKRNIAEVAKNERDNIETFVEMVVWRCHHL